MKKGSIVIICCLIMVIASLSFFLGVLVGTNCVDRDNVVSSVTMDKDGESGKAESSSQPESDGKKGDKTKNEEVGPGALVELQEKLEKRLKEYKGEWAVYVEDLGTGDKFEMNNKKMVSASLIKLFIMGSIYDEIEAGKIEKDQVYSYLKSMITVSDNESSNILVSKLGGGKYTDMKEESFQKGLKVVNEYAEKLDCTDTEQQRDMKDSRPKAIPEQNYTSVVDCGKFLGALYRNEIGSKESNVEMVELLKAQTRRDKIYAGLPKGTECANKTGELSDVENDVAIVYSPGADYVICVMANDVSETMVAKKQIAEISEEVYEFFNQD